MHQANLLVAELCSSNSLSTMESNDADFMMLAGSKLIQENAFSHSMKNSIISNVTLMMASNDNTINFTINGSNLVANLLI